MLTFNTILCPLDFSVSSDKALRNAVEMASHFHAELLLVHVLAPIPVLPAEPAYLLPAIPVMPTGSTGTLRASTSDQEDQELAAKERLALVVKQLPSEIRSRTVIGIGVAADEIVRIASTEKVDLIVIATHGVTGWRHMVFGSVAEKIVRLANQPVLVIPAHDSEEGR